MSETNERWLPVVGFPGYEVSDRGRVRGPRKLRILSTSPKGYKGLTLTRGGKPFWREVQVLVLEAFVGPRPAGMDACHFPDHDPGNNHLTNLRWDTRKANHQDRELHGNTPRGERNGNARLTVDKVRKVRAMLAAGITPDRIAAHYGVVPGTIYNIAAGISWRHVARD